MSTCQRCGAEFSCGMVDDKSDTPCWCTHFPPMPLPSRDVSPAPTCYCPVCLEALTARAPAADTHS
jgi:hypothetical protein